MFSRLFFKGMILMVASLACQSQEQPPVKIGLIVPIEHTALQEITEGFLENLPHFFPHPVSITVKNAQGDANIQKMILQQMQTQGIDLYVPLGTSTTQMTCSLIKDRPIVSLAAQDLPTVSDRYQDNCVSVSDTVPSSLTLAFLTSYFPHLKHITLVYSSSEKMIPEAQEVETYCQAHGLSLKKIMIQTHQDLYTFGKNLPEETQALFILKDNLVVSGLPLLLKEARKRSIPLIASDEGSVKNGASFALGVFEKAIGEKGAFLAAEILKGKKPTEISSIRMTELMVFIQRESLGQSQAFSLETLLKASKEKNYTVIFYDQEKKS